MYRRIIGSLALTILSISASAQSTILTRNEIEKEMVHLMERSLSAVPAGSTGAAGSGDANNRDYISPFIAALSSFSQSNGESAAFDWNFPMNTFGANHRGKLQVNLKKPPLGQAVKTALTGQSTALTELGDGLSIADDVTVMFSIAPRAGNAKQEALGMARVAAATAQSLRSQMQQGLSDQNLSAVNDALPSLATARNAREVAAMLRPAMEGTALDFAQRSKVTLDVSYRARRNLAGPDELSVKGRYEMAMRSKNSMTERVANAGQGCTENLRTAMRNARSAAVTDAKSIEQAALRTDCILSVIRAGEAAKNTDRAPRFVTSIEFQNVSANKFVLTKYGNTIVPGKSSRSIIGSLSAGMDIYVPDTITQRGRIELEVKYDDVSGDKLRNDRLIGTLTYIQTITDKVKLPVSLIYASHDDYLTNVDRKLNAHIGLSFKLPQMSKSN